MPNDCTAAKIGSYMMYSLTLVSGIQYMTRRNRKQKQSNVLIQPKQKKKQKPKSTPFADAGAIAGKRIGNLLGYNLSGVGKWLGSGIGSIFGSGDYKVVGNNVGYNVLNGQTPKFSSTHATNIVCHREYLGDVSGTTAFTNLGYPLNPGVSSTFPWLSQIAVNYQQYKFHGLVFEFRSLVTDFVTGGAPGVVVITTNYNADQPRFNSRQEAENAEFAVSQKPTENLMHMIECEPDQVANQLYNIRSGGVTAGQDLRLYDYGVTQFITQNNPNQVLGELWVSYCVEFFKPTLASVNQVTVADSLILKRGGPFTSTLPLGSTDTSAPKGTLSGGTLTPGNILFWSNAVLNQVYSVEIIYTGTNAAWSLGVSSVSGGSLVVIAPPGVQFFCSTASAETTLTFYVKASSPRVEITLSNSVGNCTAANVYVNTVDAGALPPYI